MGNFSLTNATPAARTHRSRSQFSSDTLARLQEAIDSDDIIDPRAPVPASFLHDCADTTVQSCYALCLQFWAQCADRRTMVRVVNQLVRNRPTSEADHRAYKQIRASYKHLRFAQRLYLKRHKSELFFWWLTGTMGDLQDAFKNGARGSVLRRGLVLRLLLTRPVWAWINWRARRSALDSAAGLLNYRRARMRDLQRGLTRTLFTGTQFHTLRKITSEQVSYYDTLYALHPSADLLRAMRYVGHINGLMGARHDEMVAAALSGTRDYGAPAPMDADIRTCLETFTQLYPQ